MNVKFIYLLEYQVCLIENKHIMNKQKLFSTLEMTNYFQQQYNKNFEDRKIIHYEIKAIPFDFEPNLREKGIDKLGGDNNE